METIIPSWIFFSRLSWISIWNEVLPHKIFYTIPISNNLLQWTTVQEHNVYKWMMIMKTKSYTVYNYFFRFYLTSLKLFINLTQYLHNFRTVYFFYIIMSFVFRSAFSSHLISFPYCVFPFFFFRCCLS
jgi:hypothetical protein